MIVGIGIDTVEISRIQKAVEKEAFQVRVFGEKELEMLDLSRKNKRCYEMAAGNFAGKEAVSKAFGCGISGVNLNEIQILRMSNGKPYVELLGDAKEKAKSLGIDAIHVTITNTDLVATTMVIAERLSE